MVSHVHEKSFTGGRTTIVFMAFVYAVFAFTIAGFAGTLLLVPFFAATLAPRFIGAFTGHWRATVDERRDWIRTMVVYVAALVAPILLPLPLPSIPIQNPDPASSGLWVERPETLLFTGFAYFAALVVLDLFAMRGRTLPLVAAEAPAADAPRRVGDMEP